MLDEEKIPFMVKFERYVPYLLITPVLIYMVFFIGYPLIQAIGMAFFENGHFTTANIDYLLHSPLSKFWGHNIAVYTVILPLTISDVAAGLILTSPSGFLE